METIGYEYLQVEASAKIRQIYSTKKLDADQSVLDCWSLCDISATSALRVRRRP